MGTATSVSEKPTHTAPLVQTIAEHYSKPVRAFLCRLHNRLRNVSMRRELFALHHPNPELVQADYAVLAELSKGLSGGDILNVCVNAIHAGGTDADSAKWLVTQEMLKREIAKARKAKAEHAGEKGKNRRRIGFGVG